MVDAILLAIIAGLGDRPVVSGFTGALINISSWAAELVLALRNR